MKLNILLAILGVLYPNQVFGLFHRCPTPSTESEQQESFYTLCSCNKNPNSSVFVTCQRLKADDSLEIVLQPLRKYVIDHLIIKKSGGLIISPGTFNKQNIHRIIFQDVEFMVFTLLNSLKGLEFYLESVHFINCNANLWLWHKGTSFSFLETVHFENTNLPSSLSKDMFKNFPNGIRKLRIIACGIRELGDGTFSRFGHLEYLELDRNQLVELKRSSLPSHARRLKYISLVSNPIVTLPNDTFINMDRLEFLLLSNTQLTEFSNDTFHHVWEQLEEVYLNDIKINCDCNIVWMINSPDTKLIKSPFCMSHNKQLKEIRRAREICRPNNQ